MKLKVRGTYGLIVHLLVIALLTMTLAACPGGTDEDKGGGGGEGVTGIITMAADPLSIPADGTSSTAVVALLETSSGSPVASGTKVTFTTTLGQFQNGKTTFEVTYTAPEADEETEGAAEETESFVGVSLISATTPGAAAVTAESNGVKQTIYIQFVAEGEAAVTKNILLTANPLSIAADGKSSTAITAKLLNGTADPVEKGTVVTFTTTLGIFPNGQIIYQLITTDEEGLLTVPLMAGLIPGTATVTVEADGVEQIVYIQFTDNRATAAIALTATPSSIPADGASSTSIEAVMTSTTGDPVVEGTIVIFTTTLGSFANGLATFQASTVGDGGKVVISLMSGIVSGAAVVTAESNGVNQTIYVQFTSDVDDRVTASITLLANPEAVPADGSSSTTITATLRDGANAPVPKGTAVSFMTTLGTFPNGAAVYETSTADETGVVVVSLIAGVVESSKVVVSAQSDGVTQAISLQFTGEVQPDTPTSISLATTKTSVKSDDIDSATITATVLNGSNAVVQGVSVAFSTTGGTLSAASALTDANGQAKVTFKSGSVDMTNMTATITGQVSGLTAQIPIQIVGSTLTLASTTTLIPDDGSTVAILTITAKNAGGVEVYNVLLTLTVTGGVVLEQFSADYPLDTSLAPVYTGTTNVSGQFKVKVVGTAAGSATVNAQGLGDSKDVTYTVNASSTIVFGIDSIDTPSGGTVEYPGPTFPEVIPMSRTDDMLITVNAPDPPMGVTEVTFATSLGEWDGIVGNQVYHATIVGDQASALLSSLTSAGLATVQITYRGSADPVVYTQVAISAPSSEAATLTLQSSAYVVARSLGGVNNSVTLTATVRNASDQVVGGAPVLFTITGTTATGGGEYISPVVVYTNSSGIAQATFTSGTISTDTSGVEVVATSVDFPGISDSVNIVIGGTAGSVTVGRGTVVESEYDDTVYELPMSVLVADANGNPVAGAVVTLNAWPTRYNTGAWYDENPLPDEWRFVPYFSGSYDNEDINQNLVYDLAPDEDVNWDGFLTPPNSTAGTLPPPVITDENGVANFNLFYLKANAVWINVRITASTFVLGTEVRSYVLFTLPAERTEAEDGLLPDSPWPVWVAGTGGGGFVYYRMPTFRDALVDTYSAVFGDFYDITYTLSSQGPYYGLDLSAVPAGSIINDLITIRNPIGIGVTVPIRVLAQ